MAFDKIFSEYIFSGRVSGHIVNFVFLRALLRKESWPSG